MANIHKRGDTFDRSGTIAITQNGVAALDLTGWTGASQMRGARNTLIVNFKFEWINAALRLARISAPEGTSTWPVGDWPMDIQMTSPDGVVVSTATVLLTVIADVTSV